MKAIKNSTVLEFISSIIVEHIGTRGIYCFGKHETICRSKRAICFDRRKQKRRTHLYLLVFVEERIENATNDISDKIKTKTKGKITVTLLIHQVKNLKKISDDQRCFFGRIMQNGELLYQNVEKPPCLNMVGTPKRNLKDTSLYAANRGYVIATIWNWVYQGDDVDSSSEVKMSGLHQIVEQTCLSLIRVFMGYTPAHFSLDHLFNLCAYFSSITEDFFPRKSLEDQLMFKFLKQHPCVLRFSKSDDVDYLYYQLLEERCGNFKNQATILIQAELDRLAQIENEESQTIKNKG